MLQSSILPPLKGDKRSHKEKKKIFNFFFVENSYDMKMK
jgi:hypothetical protein